MPVKPRLPTANSVPTMDIRVARKTGMFGKNGGVAELYWPRWDLRAVLVVGPLVWEARRQFMRVEFLAEGHEPFAFTIRVYGWENMFRVGCPRCVNNCHILCINIAKEQIGCSVCMGVRLVKENSSEDINHARRDPASYIAKRSKMKDQSDRARYRTAKTLMKAQNMPPILKSSRSRRKEE